MAPASPDSFDGEGSRVSTGIDGLDAVLGGGLTADRMYLVEGTPGTGKTTLGLQFLLAGAARGEVGLYITLSETGRELRAVCASHGWSLEGIEIYELVSELGLDPSAEQSILLPSDVELGETIRNVVERVERLGPQRIVFDSLSEMRLLALEPLRYRRQILALKHFFAGRATVLLLDDKSTDNGDAQLHSIAHGVVSLDQTIGDYGPQRRRLRVIKMRGIAYRGGAHDMSLQKGGLSVYPRLIAALHPRLSLGAPVTSGVPQLDALLGGGLIPGTNTLLIGPSGIGKTTTALRCLMAALERGERATYYLFDEGMATVFARAHAMGMDLQPHVDAGRLKVMQIDPGELTPGQLSHSVQQAVEAERNTFVVIDSLNAYLQAMPGQSFLLLHMHELLTYLNQCGVTTMLILSQHGLIGDIRTDLDLSYLSDAILLFRYFEAGGEVRSAMSCVKSRAAVHERKIREFRLGPDGLRVGAVLAEMSGLLAGLPSYHGDVPMLNELSSPKAG